MYDFDSVDQSYELPWDIGGQAALNDFNRALFSAFQGFKHDDAAWADLRKSEFGQWLHTRISEFDDMEFNGSASQEEDE